MISIFVMTLMAMTGVNPDELKPGDHNRSLEVDNRTRTYIIHVPKPRGGSKTYPVVLALHGGGINAEQMVHFSGLSEKADESGFIVVYPNGTGRPSTWNGGNCCGYAMLNNVDDVGFI